MVGATVSCSQDHEAGEDRFPAMSIAHTVRVWFPSARVENVGHCPQVVGPCESSWHRNVPDSVDENAKYALSAVVWALGCWVMLTTGAVTSTVHAYEEVLRSPLLVVAVTENV